MYIKLEEDYTKTRYSQILNETTQIVKNEILQSSQDESTHIWLSIKAQIEDIREKIVESHVLVDWEEIYERYTIGAFGLEYFEEDEEMQTRLCDIFHGAVHYSELK